MRSFNSKMIVVLLIALFGLGTFSLMPKDKIQNNDQEIHQQQDTSVDHQVDMKDSEKNEEKES